MIYQMIFKPGACSPPGSISGGQVGGIALLGLLKVSLLVRVYRLGFCKGEPLEHQMVLKVFLW